MKKNQKINFAYRHKKDWTVLNINVTWFCPVKCKYCHITSKGSREDKRFLAKKDLIKECRVGKQYGIKEYRFSGGEPLSLGDKLFEYADIVYKMTNKKPAVLTSGVYINEDWLQKARGKFSGIYISIENPLEPMQTIVNNKNIMKIIRENFSDEIPLRYGLTLLTASHFKNIEKIFDILYNNVNKSFMPQLEYPCLKNFIIPTRKELNDIIFATKTLFQKYEIVPYYFVNVIGSLFFLNQDLFRVVVNLNPDGKYDIYNSMIEAFKNKYRWLNYTLRRQSESDTCQKCEWIDCCKHHGIGLMFDWCELRKAIFEGIYTGLGLEGNKIKNL